MIQGMEEAMHDYPGWETGLVGEAVRDGTAAWLSTERGGGR